MKDIAIFRHAPTEGPGYFATFLSERKIPYRLIKIDEGDAVPADALQFSGLVFMGGPMSVNDDLPWIPPVLDLIRRAVEKGVPVLGHCLGGQLMAKALGGVVTRNSVKEIGWGTVRVADSPLAHEWFAEAPFEFDAFHWHGETFSLPQGATCILGSRHCANQAFVLGKHLAMQCHVEMTEDMVRAWCKGGADEVAGASASPGVQSVATMQAEMVDKLPSLNKVAAVLYAHWLKGIPQ